jgi:hypothetical protein
VTNIVSLELRRFGEILKKKTVAAGSKIGTGMKKAVSNAEARARKSGKTASFPGELATDSRIEKQQPKIERMNETPVETSRIEKPILKTGEHKPATPIRPSPSGNSTLSSKGQASQEMATECLTCENLIHCNFRNSLSTETREQVQNGISCNFANHKKIEQNKK